MNQEPTDLPDAGAKPDPQIDARDQMTARIPGIGAQGIKALRSAKVLVVGAGGVGSPVLAYLAAASVGTIGISDPDLLDETNLGRQVIHGTNRVGQVKAESAKRTVQHLNPQVKVIIEEKIEERNAAEIVQTYDLVIDATDNYQAKYLLSDVCAEVGKPHIWGTLVSMSFQISVFTCGFTLRDLYPQIPPAGSTPSSKEVGVLGAVCGQAGSIMATEAIKWITGLGEMLIGKVLIVDANRLSWDVLKFRGQQVGRAEESKRTAG